MTIKIDTTKLKKNEWRPPLSAVPAPEYQFREPEIGVERVSFPDIPTIINVITTGIIASGTITVASEPIELGRPLALKINLVMPTKDLSAAERYTQLRKEIVDSGLPLLADEETAAGNTGT